MSDRTSQELISALLDGELTPVEQAQLARRLEESLELREELAALTDVSQQVRMLPRPYAPPELRRNILEQIQRKRAPVSDAAKTASPHRNLRVLASWVSVGVAASLLLLAGWSLAPPADQQQSLAVNEQKHDAVPESAASPTAALRDEAGAQLPAESVQVVNVSREEIRRRIDALNSKPQRGNSIRVPGSLQRENGETPIIVVFTVVDVMEAMNQMQVLVRQQQIRSTDNHVLITPPNAQDRSLTAVTVELEMDGPEMAALLNSVEAFDAVMYVEQNLTAASDRRAEPAASPAEPPASSRSALPIARNADRASQRQFNFQQLAEEGPPETAMADRERVAGRISRGRADPQAAGSAVPELSLPMTKAAPAPSSLTAPSSLEQALPASPGWEDARRFRAFILLKKRTE